MQVWLHFHLALVAFISGDLLCFYIVVTLYCSVEMATQYSEKRKREQVRRERPLKLHFAPCTICFHQGNQRNSSVFVKVFFLSQ